MAENVLVGANFGSTPSLRAGGLDPAEINDAMDLIRKIRGAGTPVLMIEHHMKAVAGVCERVMVLNFGTKIAEGVTREVQTNPQVIEAYSGDHKVVQ